MSIQRESMDFDVLIVGGGPAGLAAAIRLAQLAKEKQQEISICLIDKGIEIGANILSGAVIEPRALNELIPDWQARQPPELTPVTEDQFRLLTKKKSIRLPTPPQMHNKNNFIISLGQLCRWMSKQAEDLGVNIFPGFAAKELIFNDEDKVCGIITDDKGLNRFGEPKAQFQPGMELRAKQTMFAEGCRGSLTQQLFKKFNLRAGVDPQTYGLGIKEIWEIPAELHKAGKVVHTIGWPLKNDTYGGSFVYHWGKNLLSIGFVIGLDYTNPYLNPYEEFQRFKLHPSIYPLLENSQRLSYGARTLVEGGLQSIPKLSVPGGIIIGDAAGFLNVAKIKGIHNAMKSGMTAAESIFPMLQDDRVQECTTYAENLKKSWLWEDLYKVRNIRPALRWGLWPGLAYSAIDSYLFRGHAPWTFHHHIADNESIKKADQCEKIQYPKHDNKVTFDLSTSVYLANVHYIEDQPYHLKLKDRHIVPIEVNYKQYASPETRYCPAGVYEIVRNDKDEPRLHINGGNCIHCKACDIKDPTQNIVWTPSEGGSGPDYSMM